MVILWFLWKSRNAARFEGTAMSPGIIILQVSAFIQQLGRGGRLRRKDFQGDADCEWATFGMDNRRQVIPRAVTWALPPTSSVKLNTDASVTEGLATGGGLVRTSDGDLVFAFYKEFGECDVLTAEALALLEGLRLCYARHIMHFVAEVDSSVLVRMVSSCGPARWPLVNTLRHIQWLSGQMGVSVAHIYREANTVADALACSRPQQDGVFTVRAELPRKARSALQLDRLSVPSIRLGRVRH
nr:uncharacterized protein LOC113687334 [Coffea arabica]